MAKKRVSHSKASRSGKTKQDTEIRRAKQALSAALTDDVSDNLSAAENSQNSAMHGKQSTLDSAGNSNDHLVQQGDRSLGVGELAGASVRQSQLGVGLDWILPGSPLTDLARRHVQRVGQLQNALSIPIDNNCRDVLRGLARKQLQVASQQVENKTTPFAT